MSQEHKRGGPTQAARQSGGANENAKHDDDHTAAFHRLTMGKDSSNDRQSIAWDDAKDQALWKMISEETRGSEIDWKELTAQFEVSLPFILQQAAWLYERQLSQVRAQMRRVSRTDGKQASRDQETPRLSPHGFQTQQQGDTQLAGSPNAAGTSPPTRQSLAPTPRFEPNYELGRMQAEDAFASSRRRQAPSISRTTSSNTVTQSYRRPATRDQAQARVSTEGPTLSRTESPREGYSGDDGEHAKALSSSSSNPASSTSSDSDEDEEGPSRGQVTRRPSKFTASRIGAFRNIVGRPKIGVKEDEETPFLHFSQAPEEQQDVKTTMRDQKQPREGQSDGTSSEASRDIAAVDSPASSAVSSAAPRETPFPQPSPSSTPSSSHRRAELAVLNAKKRGKAREGSEGTPSMGSSFSDLDDNSVTQSALEEALLSNVQRGGATSRMSNLSQALRSQYSRYQGSS